MNATFYYTSGIEDKKQISDDSNVKRIPLEMCCFGIGVTRILAAFIANSESVEIDWPIRIAPYHVLIISPKAGSKENVDEIGTKVADNIANALKLKGFDVLIDNRLKLTIGRRQTDSLTYGFPYRVIIGKKSVEEIPKFEFISKDQKELLTHAELLNKFDKIAMSSLS
jgi:prolyl-tRNA synthetase